jgi:ATP-dependent Clp protease ATP-binding subunit ClpA
LKRAIQNHIEDVLAEHLLLGKYPAGSTIEVDANADDGLVMRAMEQQIPVEAAASS